MPSILLHGLAALVYAALAAYFWQSRWGGEYGGVGHGRARASGQMVARAGGFQWWERVVLVVGVGLHGALLADDLFGGGQFRFGFAHALSMMAWLALVFYGVESFAYPLEGMPALVLPPAAVSVMLPVLYGGAELSGRLQAPAFIAHVMIAMFAYGFIAIAAAHAVLMMVIERRLHAKSRTAPPLGLPPLLTMERLLFQMIGLGFLFLSMTVASGIVFSEEIFGRALTLDHKTIFGLLAWVIFAVLLLGRMAYGWRGRTALNGTLAGFAALLLAYIGSRFVLEALLGRV